MASVKHLGGSKYKITISNGFKPDGSRNRIFKNIEAKSEAAALKQANAMEAEIVKGDYLAPTKLTFSEYVEQWKPAAERKSKESPKTFKRYEELLKLQILPLIGGYKLEAINPVIIENAYEKLREPRKREYVRKDGKKTVKVYTLSESTIKHCHRLIGLILETAYKKGLIRENPIKRVDAPKIEEREHNIYDDEQIQTLMDALEGADLQFKTIMHLALSTGAREGELTGLEWKDIDFSRKTMEIRQSAQYLPGRGIFLKQPKNKSSKRIVGLNDYVLDLILQLQHEQKVRKMKLGTKWNGGNLGDTKSDSGNENSRLNMLFIQADGSPIYPYTPVKQLKKFLEEKGLPPLRFHDLRHTAASYAISMGDNVANVSRMLGHANSNTTLGIYTHAFKKQHEVTASKMGTMYEKRKGSVASVTQNVT